MYILSFRAVITKRLPLSELELINDNQWRRLFTKIVKRPSKHGISGINENDSIPPCPQWALDDTPLQHCPKAKRMHVADQSKQVCVTTSSDKRYLTTTPFVSLSSEVVWMTILTRGKPAWSLGDIAPSSVLHDAVYQDHNEKKVQTIATLEHLLKKLAEKTNRIREHHHLPQDSQVIIIMDSVASHNQEALTPIKGHLHQGNDHPS